MAKNQDLGQTQSIMPDLKVLVVEDVDAMRLLLQELFSSCPGFRLSGLAKNSWEARLELSRRRPDLVLLDEILPGESSLDLLSELNSQKIPVFLISGYGDLSRPLPLGALGRLAKPAWETLEEDRVRIGDALRAALSG